MKKPKFLKKVKRIHFTGIGGIAMSSLAFCAQDLGIKVSGSDTADVYLTDKILKTRKISWKTGFSQKNLSPKPDLLVATGAHQGLNNPEVVAARKLGIPVMTHAQTLGKFMEGKDGLSVCGVGGKSTTSAMIATVLDVAGRSPSYAIGVGGIKPLGVAGRYTAGKEFVAEADEYANSPGVDNRPRFLFQKPKVIVVTNIEYDHPDIYQNLGQTKAAYEGFFKRLPKNGLLVACADNTDTMAVAKKFSDQCQTYGFTNGVDWQIEKVSFAAGQVTFSLIHRGMKIEGITLKVPGRFNVANATAAFAVGTFLGLNPRVIQEGLAKFGGTKRRFEFIGRVGEVDLYDDYAHHPEEIKATLKAAKLWFPGQRLVVIFQPHTYSRTQALFDEFSRAFGMANLVVISDIYASAREKDDLKVNSRQLVQAASQFHSRVFYQPGKKEVIKFLKKKAQSGDVVFTMGAGDIFLWHKNILKSLKN